jgi:hypothetical protein
LVGNTCAKAGLKRDGSDIASRCQASTCEEPACLRPQGKGMIPLPLHPNPAEGSRAPITPRACRNPSGRDRTRDRADQGRGLSGHRRRFGSNRKVSERIAAGNLTVALSRPSPTGRGLGEGGFRTDASLCSLQAFRLAPFGQTPRVAVAAGVVRRESRAFSAAPCTITSGWSEAVFAIAS